MDSTTPAATIRTKDLVANAAAFKQLLTKVPLNSIKSVCDIRYGLGGWARCLEEALEGANLPRMLGFELDKDTYDKAYMWPGSIVRNSFPNIGIQCDLLLADFNTCTQKKRRELDWVLDSCQANWLIFTDVACSKFHLNKTTYGLPPTATMADYWYHFHVKGYKLVAWAKQHHAASTALFQSEIQYVPDDQDAD